MCCLMPRQLHRPAQTFEENWGPQSEVASSSTSNQRFHPCSRAYTQAAAVADIKGIVSGDLMIFIHHGDDMSLPSVEVGRGLTKSM
jgi:hypothetical protein